MNNESLKPPESFNLNGYLQLLEAIFNKQRVAFLSTKDEERFRKTFEEVLWDLTPRRAEVIRLRFGLKDGIIRDRKEVSKYWEL